MTDATRRGMIIPKTGSRFVSTMHIGLMKIVVTCYCPPGGELESGVGRLPTPFSPAHEGKSM